MLGVERVGGDNEKENEGKWQEREVRVTGTQSAKVVLTWWPGKEASTCLTMAHAISSIMGDLSCSTSMMTSEGATAPDLQGQPDVPK